MPVLYNSCKPLDGRDHVIAIIMFPVSTHMAGSVMYQFKSLNYSSQNSLSSMFPDRVSYRCSLVRVRGQKAAAATLWPEKYHLPIIH